MTFSAEAKLQASLEARAPKGPVETNPLYGVAMLKIAMELKKPDAAGLDEIVSGVLGKMNLPEDAFRAFLAQNGGLLKAIAEKKQY